MSENMKDFQLFFNSGHFLYPSFNVFIHIFWKRSGIILATNYEARSHGVWTPMVLHEALKLCPRLILVPPDHRFYQQKSERLFIAGFYGADLLLNLFDQLGNTYLKNNRHEES